MAAITTIGMESGLTLLVEPIASVSSAAITWLIPAGSAADPPAGDGRAAMLSDMIFRGAGGLTSRQHSDALDRLGVQRDCQVLTHHLSLGATMIGERLPEAMPLLVDMIRRPALPEDALNPVRSLCLQAIDGLEDDPQHLVMLRLRQRHLKSPFNRHGYGERGVIESMTIEDLRQAWTSRFVPLRSIVAAAGAVDPEALSRQLSSLLDGWRGSCDEPAELSPAERGSVHVQQDTSQVHIGVAWDAPREADESSMLERLGVNVLSGSSSARLFTEVRQKRSLCYSVGASYAAGRDDGVVSLYAGTTPQRAQETLEVSLAEVERLRQGATAAEFARAVVGLKSHLIMQGESTAARAAAMARDQFRLGHARTLDELAEQVDAVTLKALNSYLADRRTGPYTIATVGPAELAAPDAARAIAAT